GAQARRLIRGFTPVSRRSPANGGEQSRLRLRDGGIHGFFVHNFGLGVHGVFAYSADFTHLAKLYGWLYRRAAADKSGAHRQRRARGRSE
ncbi:hypothetical protein AB3X89_40550, partial [Paraburkholderia sp. BR14320]|uniref:hypothetical protein n=1 Tax=Paraburkholderia sp. BR14320 TaxID=3237006 RepID=UPI0034CD5350